MIIERKPGKTKNTICTIAIGSDCYNAWNEFAKFSWLEYCEKYDLGLLCFNEDLVDKNDQFWKKPTWQKLLIGKKIKKEKLPVKNICFLDTDIIISPIAPNVFDSYNTRSFGLVSLRKNLPFPYHEVIKRIAFFRNRFYDKKYPLDSALFISIEDLYKYHNLDVQEDEACMGFFIFNLENHSEIMEKWFQKYTKDIKSISNGGDQTHLNYEIQSTGSVDWLEYKYQAIWVFEMAWHYSFLYQQQPSNENLINLCIDNSLLSNYFLHFAGSWHESSMWKMRKNKNHKNLSNIANMFDEYLHTKTFGKPLGIIKPNIEKK